MKKFWIFLVCIVLIGCVPLTASAEDIQSEQTLLLENMERERITISNFGVLEKNIMLRNSNPIHTTVFAYSHVTSDQKFYLEDGRSVTINCSYTPSSASMDFGVIAPDGYFYFVNVEGGNINRSIKVNQSGNYAVAIRNNSSDTVKVVGFVNY